METLFLITMGRFE